MLNISTYGRGEVNDFIVERFPGADARTRAFTGEIDFVPVYELHTDKLIVDDSVWGRAEIKPEGPKDLDNIWLELATNPLVERMLAIEQLTLDPRTETIPNAAMFSRWEHIWGSVVFVRKVLEQQGRAVNDRDAIILQLRTFVSDLGHTAFSHMGDWLFQGVGKGESQHDDELPMLMEIAGINDILKKYNITPQEVTFPPGQDWIETRSPYLCVDRVDYAAREINRWLKPLFGGAYTLGPQDFFVDAHGRLAMRSPKTALHFAKAYALLASEHWQEPMHRLQLHLMEDMTRYVLTDENTRFAASVDPNIRAHPRDEMYTVDSEILSGMTASTDEYLQVLRDLAESIGEEQRRHFIYRRAPELHDFLADDHASEMPAAGVHGRFFDRVPVFSSRVDIKPYGNNLQNGLKVDLPPRKLRMINPLVDAGNGKVYPLSKIDKNYKKLFLSQLKYHAGHYMASVLLTEPFREVISAGQRITAGRWAESLKKPRLNPRQMRQVIGRAAGIGYGRRFVPLFDYGLKK